MNGIKEVFKEQGRTQTWLTEKTGKSYRFVANYCNNKAQPSIEVLTKIAKCPQIYINENKRILWKILPNKKNLKEI
jgi:hypothetical protein